MFETLDSMYDMVPAPSEESRFGWAGPDAANEFFDQVADQCVDFQLFGATESTAGKRYNLYDDIKIANGGEHFPALRQLLGTCAAQSMVEVCLALAARQQLRDRTPSKLVLPYAPWFYGASRVVVLRNRFVHQEGSTATAVALVAKTLGVLPTRETGLRQPRLYLKDGQPFYIEWGEEVERAWSNSAELVEQYKQPASTHLVRSVARLKSYEEVRDAVIGAKKPVLIAFQDAFGMKPVLDKGKMWGVRLSGEKWGHCQAIWAVDDDPRRPGVFTPNTWGPDAHGPAAGDEPNGGFWRDADLVDDHCRNGEVVAVTDMDDFTFEESYDMV